MWSKMPKQRRRSLLTTRDEEWAMPDARGSLLQERNTWHVDLARYSRKTKGTRVLKGNEILVKRTGRGCVMKPNLAHKTLFAELKEWGNQKNSYSVNDFLRERGISINELELIADTDAKFMKIWGVAESQAWENVQDALFSKSLPRSKIAEYIQESDVFQGEAPEEIMQDLESGQVKLELYLTAMGDTESLRKYGRLAKMNDTEALMKCSLERGVITKEEYLYYLQIEKESKENDDEDT